MKIAVFHNMPSGGAKRALFEWLRCLKDIHQIDVYTLSTSEHNFCDVRSLVSDYKVFDFKTQPLFNSPFGRLNQVQRWRGLRSLDRLNRQIASEINYRGYDILFTNTCIYTFVPGVLLYTDIPSLHYLHETLGSGALHHFERPYLSQNKLRQYLDLVDPLIHLYRRSLASIQKRAISKPQRVLANSQFTSTYIRSEFEVDVSFCPYGVNLNGFRPIENLQREKFVVSVGEMSPRKGFDFIVESLGKIPKAQRPSLKLACNTVNNDELNYVSNLARHREVTLEVLANIGVDELRLLYNRAMLCVYAPVMEPFGLVPLEAMACGTPVVGVREGGVKESIVHEFTGLLVDRNADHFSDAIQHLLSHPNLIDIYGRNGREHVIRNWTWERSTSILNSYLIECAGLDVGSARKRLSILEKN